MTDRSRAPLDDAALVAALRELAPHIDWPTGHPGPDLATRVRAGLAAGDGAGRSGLLAGWRPLRRGLVLAILAVIAAAAVVTATLLGLPGLRLTLTDPGASARPSMPGQTFAPASAPTTADPLAPGANLGLGTPIAPGDVATLTGQAIAGPSDPAIGPPDAVYVDVDRANQVALVWRASARLPASLEPGVGLVLMRFDGSVDAGLYEKMVGGETSVEPVAVGGQRAFWISGDPHLFFYVSPAGRVIEDQRRWVGDALVWSDGRMTYRLESALGRDAAIALAETIE
jgi:hypothetical protein